MLDHVRIYDSSQHGRRPAGEVQSFKQLARSLLAKTFLLDIARIAGKICI